MKSSIHKNILANIIGKIWNIISVFIFVPIYLDFLGVESYGVISFYTVILTVLAFADAGLSATLNREFAREDGKDLGYNQNLLRTFEYLFFSISCLVAIGIFVLAPFIVSNFLKSNDIPFDELVFYVRIMGVIIVFQMGTSLYQGGLIGLQKQVLSNTLVVLYGIFRSVLVLIPLYFYRNLSLYFYWQLISILIFFFTTRYCVFKLIKVPNIQIKASIFYLKRIWKYALGMVLMSVIYSVNTQLDKLSISNLMSLKDFSYYSIASMLGQSVLMIATPLGIAFYPEITRLVSLKKYIEVSNKFHLMSFFIATITSILSVVVILFSYDLVLLWTGDEIIASSISYPVLLLTLGNLFLSIQISPYYLALSHGHTQTNIIFGVLGILIVLPLLHFLIPSYGMIGAAFTWFVIRLAFTFFIGYVLISKYLKNEFFKWIFYDSFLPLFTTLFTALPIYYLVSDLEKGWYVILYSFIIALTALIANVLVAKFINPSIELNKI